MTTDQTTGTTNRKTSYFYKLFRVKRKDGRVTTVSMNPVLVTHACRVMGGIKPVSQVVRNAAKVYEDGQARSCSFFVAESLNAEVNRTLAERRSGNMAKTVAAEPALA